MTASDDVELTEHSLSTEALGKIAAGWGIDAPTDPNVIHAMAHELHQYRRAAEGYPDLGSLLANHDFYDGASGITPRDASRLVDILRVTGWLGDSEVYPRLPSSHGSGPIEGIMTDIMNLLRNALSPGKPYLYDAADREFVDLPDADGATFLGFTDRFTATPGGIGVFVSNDADDLGAYLRVVDSQGSPFIARVSSEMLLRLTYRMVSALACVTQRNRAAEKAES